MGNEVRRTLSVEEAAPILGIGRSLAYQLIERGEFPVRVLRLGGRIMIPRDALDAVLSGDREPCEAHRREG